MEPVCCALQNAALPLRLRVWGLPVEVEFLVILSVAVAVLGTALGLAWWDAERDFKSAKLRSKG